MNRKICAEELSRIAQRAAEDSGHAQVATAEWKAFGDIKIQWVRTFGKNIEFRVPDYLDMASEKALYEMLLSIIKTIYGEEVSLKGAYPESFMSYIHSQMFRDLKREVCLSRKKYLCGSGEVHDLYDILDDAVEKGDPLYEDIVPVWSTRLNAGLVTYSPSFRVIAIPVILDREEIPTTIIRKLVIEGAERIRYDLLTMRDYSLIDTLASPKRTLTDEEMALVGRYL